MTLSFTAFDAMLHDRALADAAALDRLARDYPPNRALVGHLVALAESHDPTVQRSATALLKRYVGQGTQLDKNLAARLLSLLPRSVPWEAALHILQMLPRLSIRRSRAEALCDGLVDLSTHPNKFLRAWAYSGLHRLGMEFADYRRDVLPLLERASREEAPSVRARLRQLPPLPTEGG